MVSQSLVRMVTTRLQSLTLTSDATMDCQISLRKRDKKSSTIMLSKPCLTFTNGLKVRIRMMAPTVSPGRLSYILQRLWHLFKILTRKIVRKS
jgi:hypothetical protein